MNMPLWFDQAFCERLTAALLHFLWQGTAIGALALLASQLLQRASSRSRYLAYVVAMVLMVCCLPVTFLLVTVEPPSTSLVTGRLVSGEEHSPTKSDLDSNLSSTENATFATPDSDVKRQGTAVAGSSSPVPFETLPPANAIAAPSEIASSAGQSWLRKAAPSVTGLYLAGVVALLVRLLRGAWASWQMGRASIVVTETDLLDRVRAQAERFGLRVMPALRWCGGVSVPVVIGVLRPIILLPTSAATGLSMDQLQAVVAHELAHVRRYDLAVNLLQRVIESLLFFHPAVWWISRQITNEREQACDELVLSAGLGRAQYADALVKMAELSNRLHGRTPTTALAASGASATVFKQRVLKVLGSDVKPQLRLSRVTGLAAIATVLLALAIPIWWNHAAAEAGIDLRGNSTERGAAAMKDEMESPLADEFADRVIQRIREQNLPFVEDKHLDVLRAEMQAYLNDRVPVEIAVDLRKEIFLGIDGYVAQQFHDDDSYLGFRGNFDMFKWRIWTAAARKELTAEELARREAQRDWMRDYVRSLPDQRGIPVAEWTHEGRLRELEQDVFANVMTPFFYDPMTDEEFSRFQKLVHDRVYNRRSIRSRNRDEPDDAGTVIDANPLPSALIHIPAWMFHVAVEARLENLQERFPPGFPTGDKSMGGTTHFGFARNTSGRAGYHIGQANDHATSYDALRQIPVTWDGLDLAVKKDGHWPGDLWFDPETNVLMTGRAGTAKLAVLDQKHWYEVDRVPLSELKKLAETNGVGSYQLPAYSPTAASDEVDKLPTFVLQPVDGSVVVFRIAQLQGDYLYVHFRPRPLPPYLPFHPGDEEHPDFANADAAPEIKVGMTFDEVVRLKGKHYRPQIGMGVGQLFLYYDDMSIGIENHEIGAGGGRVFRVDPARDDLDEILGDTPYADAHPDEATDGDMLEHLVSLSAENMPLRTAVEQLARQAGLSAEFDAEALRQVGLNLQRPVSVDFTNVSLSRALSCVIDWQQHFGAMSEVRGKRLVLTTLAAWQERTVERLPEWMQPLYNHGLLVRNDEDDTVRSVTVGAIMTDELLGKIAGLPQLRKLEFELTAELTPNGLAQISEMRQLERLAVSMHSDAALLGNDVIRSVAGNRTLRELDITECGVTDAGAKLLEQMPQLRSLRLRQEGRLSDEALKSIGKLTQLESLSLDSYVGIEGLGWMRFSTDGIRELRGLGELRSLHLVGQEVPVDAMNFPKLTSLGLGHVSVDDAVAAKIGELASLRSLELTYCSVGDEGLKAIAALPELTQLDISANTLTDAGIAHLAVSQRLTHLSLRANGLTDRSLEYIAGIKTLTRLDLHGDGNPGVSAGRNFTATGLAHLKQLPALETLWLTNFQLGGSYAVLKEMRQLDELTMMMCNIRDDELEMLEAALPKTHISHMTGGGGWIPKRIRQAAERQGSGLVIPLTPPPDVGAALPPGDGPPTEHPRERVNNEAQGRMELDEPRQESAALPGADQSGLRAEADLVSQELLKKLVRGGKIDTRTVNAAVTLVADRAAGDGKFARQVMAEFDKSYEGGQGNRHLLATVTELFGAWNARRWRAQLTPLYPDDQAQLLLPQPDPQFESDALALVIRYGGKADRADIDDFTRAVRALHHPDSWAFLRDVMRNRENRGDPFSPSDPPAGKWKDNIGGGWTEAKLLAAVGLAELGETDGVDWLLAKARRNEFGIDESLWETRHFRDPSGSLRESSRYALADLFGQSPESTAGELEAWWKANQVKFIPRPVTLQPTLSGSAAGSGGRSG